MAWMMVAMLGVVLLAAVLAIVMLAKRKNAHANTGAAMYEVFDISGGRLTVLAGLPVTYQLEEIARVTLAARKAPRSMSAYNGVLHVVKKNGKKSRPFLFDSSVYKKKMVLISSKQEIEEAIRYLMEELKRHHIPCSRVL